MSAWVPAPLRCFSEQKGLVKGSGAPARQRTRGSRTIPPLWGEESFRERVRVLLIFGSFSHSSLVRLVELISLCVPSSSGCHQCDMLLRNPLSVIGWLILARSCGWGRDGEMSETVWVILITFLVAVEAIPGQLDVFLPKGDGDIYPWRTVGLTLAGRELDGFSALCGSFLFASAPEVRALAAKVCNI